MSNVPAGWYPDQAGDLRYWDGNAWTANVQPAAPPPPPAQPVAPPPGMPGAQGQYPSGQMTAVAPTGGGMYGNLRTDRSLLMYILLSLITFGFYGVWLIASSGEDLNTIAGRYDRRRTMNYWLMFFIIGPITIGIAELVWWHRTSDRIANEARRRGLAPEVRVSDFWLWGVLGILILVGPLIFTYKWLKGMNQISGHYNQFG